MKAGIETFARGMIGSLAILLCTAVPPAALAQSSAFSPVARVDGRVVTAYELDQRTRFLTLLGAPGEVLGEVLDRLIDERLQLEAAEEVGASLSDEAIQSGMAEFAGRANLTTDEFFEAITARGVAPETFREFVRVGLVWREAVRARFGDSIRRSLSEADVARAAATADAGASTRVLLSEIVLPAPNAAAAEEARRRAEEIAAGATSKSFAAAAREFSAAPSAEDGGAVGWIALSSLPEAVGQLVAELRPGQVTPPVPVANGIALFQLRDIRREAAGAPMIEYAELLIPGGQSAAARGEAARVKAAVDTCDDLYSAVRGGAEGQLLRETRAPGQIPADVAAELSRLDPGEVSTALTRGNALVLIMLCSRGAGADAPAIVLEGARQALANRRLGAEAERWLAELRANATIEILR